jgi:hypothetical protein
MPNAPCPVVSRLTASRLPRGHVFGYPCDAASAAAYGRLPEWPKGTVCKTVGSAYVGSNPTPATHLRRSEPVTLDCVTGSCAQRERLRRPSAVSCGPCVGQICAVPVAAHCGCRCLLSCENGHRPRRLQGRRGNARPENCGPRRGRSGSFTDIWRTASGRCQRCV